MTTDLPSEYASQVMDTPVGLLLIETNQHGVTHINFKDEQPNTLPPATGKKAANHLKMAVSQLQEYFAGKRIDFNLTLAPTGSVFQQQVWQQLQTIPYGSSQSYLDIAKNLDNEKAVRAVGLANGKNPISIIVPCHRVIGSNGKLTGYAGGLWRKEWLLKHEKHPLFAQQPSLFDSL